MNIIILGSGLLGISTAYELGKRGHDVTVLDRCDGVGRETSFSNGGQLSYSAAEPWPTPSVLTKIPKWLLDKDAPLVFHPRLDPAMWLWLIKFLRNCTPARTRYNCVNLLRLNLYSKQKMDVIRAETAFDFNFTQKGILHVYGCEQDVENGKRQVDFQEKFGCTQRILTREQCLELEPCLAYTGREIAGGMYAPLDELGDAYTYCVSLAKVAAERYNVKFLNNVDIKSLRVEGDRITAVQTSQGDVSADGYVMALGSYSTQLLATVGIRLPVYPMKGYSLTFDADAYTPNSSIMDCNYKVVYTRLGDKLRISGTAELAGYNQNVRKKRIATLQRAAQSMMPQTDWSRPAHEWACLRPSTPDGLPRLGYTSYKNLFLNTGHGTLGWTQAAGSAYLVADLIERKPPEISLDGMILG
ncbi:MAG: D-amino acid dehydrogenase [Alphaproteobacteria bacterium]